MNGKIYVYFNKKKYEQEKIKKYYVGQTTREVSSRAGSNGSGYHKYDKNIKSKFVNAIRKWGWNAFELSIIEDGIKNQTELNEKEKYYISFYDSFNNGYNSTEGGDGVTGCKNTGMYGKVFTEEHRRKLSLSHIGKPSARKGKPHTEEAKAKIREARKRQVGENHPMYGKHHSMETKLKMATPIYCKELDMKFDSIALACEYSEKHNLKANRPNIIANCKGRRGNAGFIIIDGQKIKLHWSYINKTPTTTERENLD